MTDVFGGRDGWTYLACGLADVPTDDRWLSDAEADRISSFRFEKRRSETRLSRWTAKQAVARALRFGGAPLAERDLRRITIRNAPDGAPEAFVDGASTGLSISMTDRADWAVCIVAGASSIGCDLELVEPRSDAFVRDWFTADERATVAAGGPDQHDLLTNLIWSAKESALKVLRTGLRRDTRSVEVRLDGSVPSSDRWSPLVVISLDDADDGASFAGWSRRFGDFILTCAATTERPPPTSLVVPTPLTTATPSHAWTGAPLVSRFGSY